MSTSLGNFLPKRILDYLNYRNDRRDNSVIFILTTDENGFSHVAMLSPYQVVASSEKELYFTMYEGTKSQKYLQDAGRGTLIVQADPSVDYIKFQCVQIRGWKSRRDELLYKAAPIDVLEDYHEEVPYPSRLRFDTKTILQDYTLGFEEIRHYIANH